MDPPSVSSSYQRNVRWFIVCFKKVADNQIN